MIARTSEALQPQDVALLLVDDHPRNLDVLEAVLEPLGHRLVRASSGMEAVAYAARQEFAVILMDVRMPEMDGFETVQYIKGGPNRGTPVIFLTAEDAEMNNALRGYAAGAVDYLLKPFSPEAVSSKTRVLVDLFLARKDVERRAATLERLEQTARNAAQLAAKYIARLRDVSSAVAEASTPTEIGRVVLDATLSATKASAGLLALMSAEVEALNVELAVGYREARSGADAVIALTEQHPLANAVRSREAVFLSSRSELESARGGGRAASLRGACVALPLLSRGAVLGALEIAYDHDKQFDEDERAFLVAIAKMCADGLERARLFREVTQLNATLEQRVTERTRELQEANRELEAFSYSVSHDLRAPLRHIAGFALLLEKRAHDQLDESAQGFLRTITEAAQQGGKLVDDLLAFSRMGRTDLKKVRVQLGTLVEQARSDVAPEAQGRSVTWHIGALPEVEADAAMMRLVFRNLFSNAVKYTRRRSEAQITVSAQESREAVEVTVSDNGVGFEMQYADKLFGVFQRLHSAEEFEGTGIGLANVRRIIERHGGTIWAHATPGEGASFHFTLPRAGKRLGEHHG